MHALSIKDLKLEALARTILSTTISKMDGNTDKKYAAKGYCIHKDIFPLKTWDF